VLKDYASLLRIKHYIKNLLIFAPLFFAQEFSNLSSLIQLSLAFVGFSFIASFVYIINDIVDIKFDKNHNVKCKRPIAAGTISTKNAILISILCLTFGFFILNNIYIYIYII